MVEPEHIVEKVSAELGEGTTVDVTDLTGTRDHYRAVVVSPAFQGKLPIKRHRMVYAALAEEMKGPIHALTLETFTPQEWEKLA
ncbi:MAG: BolA family protein [Myxococcota bacterium]|jgi:stress-induced morphogen|nr:BolA family protein [Myxococcota bacterium]